MNKLSYLPPVQDAIVEVENLIRAQAEGYHPDLAAAINLLLSSGGKRIRPALVILSGRMLGGDREPLIAIATAIELLHTATLVHDDLIDGSLLRRGIPTLNSQWSSNATILSGDFIFARAAEMSTLTKSVRVIQLFAHTLAVIANGELNQLFDGHCSTNKDDYYARIYAKTASLFETATTSGAILAHAPESIIQKLKRFGYEIGMAFQMVDDILDYTGEQATIGKPVGNDLRQGILTLPAILYIESHPDDPDVQPILKGDCLQDDQQITRLLASIQASGAIQDAHNEACEFARRGMKELDGLPDSPERDSLLEIAQYIVDRKA